MCDFPSSQLLAEMRRVARAADDSRDQAQIGYAANYARLTGELRMAHEDVTGCQCWYEAVEHASREDVLHG